ncbi:MAG: ABC transporter ATP-binding protein [Thermodesulfobacteriota bacterium]
MIKLVDLHKSFDGLKVLDGINLEIKKGEITVIIGGSGCGKSVLLKHIIGLIRPDSGHVFVDDIDITELKEKDLDKIRRRFGMLFQSAALFDSMTVGENVGFPLAEHTDLSKREIAEIVAGKLADVGLSGIEDKYPAELSGGMKKRVGLARAIAMDPEIILFDEPTTGLDPIMTTVIDELILDIQRRLHLTCVANSHDIQSTFKIANKIGMLYKGKIVEEGDPEVFRNSRNPIVQGFLKGIPEDQIIES